MKRLTTYLKDNEKLIVNQRFDEKLIINKNYKGYTPTSFNELRNIIEQRYEEHGPGTEQSPIDFNDIDVSKIDSFYNIDIYRGIFEETEFEYIDISNWDVSNVEDMCYIFYKCRQLKSVGDLSNWNVSGVKDIQYIFFHCDKLTSVGDLSGWDVSKVENMQSMFDGCEKLESVGNLSRWDVSNVENMQSMFEGCKKLESVGDLSNWDVSNVENMYEMFYNSGIKNKPRWYK